MSRNLQVKPSKEEKHKSDFTALGKISILTLIYGLSLKSLKWLNNETMREIKHRERKV